MNSEHKPYKERKFRLPPGFSDNDFNDITPFDETTSLPERPKKRRVDQTKYQEQLVSLAIRGDKEAFQHIYKQYFRLVCAMIYQKVSTKEDVEDLAQETFLRAWRNLPNLRKPKRFLPWLLSIARHLVTDWYRSTARNPESSFQNLDFLSKNEDPSKRLSSLEEHEQIIRSLRKLPEKYRLVLIMRFLEGLSPVNISARLNEPSGTIRNRIFRALEKMEILMNHENRKRR